MSYGPTRFASLMGMKEVKATIGRHLNELWKNRWESAREYRQTRFWFPSISPGVSRELVKVSRPELGSLVKFITGFNSLAYHQFNQNKTYSDRCRLCLTEREEAIHLAVDCPVLTPARLASFGPFGPSTNWRLSELRSFVNAHTVQFLIHTTPLSHH